MSERTLVEFLECCDCAKVILKRYGYTNTQDINQLGTRLADTVQDFLADLQNEEVT